MKKQVQVQIPAELFSRLCAYHGKTELDAAGFIRADENDKRAPA